MDASKSLLPKEKTVDCLEDLGKLSVKELKHVLVQYREKHQVSKPILFFERMLYFVVLKISILRPVTFQMKLLNFVTRVILPLRSCMISASIFLGHLTYVARWHSIFFSCMNTWSFEHQSLSIYFLRVQPTRNLKHSSFSLKALLKRLM